MAIIFQQEEYSLINVSYSPPCMQQPAAIISGVDDYIAMQLISIFTHTTIILHNHIVIAFTCIKEMDYV